MSWAGPLLVAAGSHGSKMPPIEAELTSWEIKIKVCEHTGCMCLCELGGVSQTAGLGLSRSHSAVCECLVS